MVRACKKSRLVTELNFELKANVSCRFYFRFARFYAVFNFRWAYFDLFSWRVHLGVDCAHVQQKTLSSILNFFCIASTPGISNLWFFITLRSYKVDLIPLLLTVLLNWLYPVLPMNNWQVGLANSSHDCNIYCYQLNKYSGLWVPALMPNPAKLLNHEFLECLCLLCISL